VDLVHLTLNDLHYYHYGPSGPPHYLSRYLTDDKESTSSYLFRLGFRPIVWSCKNKTMVSLLTTKEEYHGVVHVGIRDMWIQLLMGELLGFLGDS
jgi:hypothetical protein